MDITKTRHEKKDWTTRLIIIISSVTIWYLAEFIFKPTVNFYTSSLFKVFEPGLRELLKHIFVYSMPTAALCVLWYAILVKFFNVRGLSFKLMSDSILKGVGWALMIVLATVAVCRLAGLEFNPHFNGWIFIGNVFSNFFEEIIFRGFLLNAFSKALNSPLLAAIASGALFGAVHYQYPWYLMLVVGLIGLLLSIITLRSNTLIPAIVAHDISDWILDLIF